MRSNGSVKSPTLDLFAIRRRWYPIRTPDASGHPGVRVGQETSWTTQTRDHQLRRHESPTAQ